MEQNVLMAFIITFLAGLATGAGSIIAFFVRGDQRRFLSFGLGLSAGVMVYVSFMEIMPEATASLVDLWGEKTGSWASVAGFFAGLLLTALIDRLVPAGENPHEVRAEQKLEAIKEDAEAGKGDAGLLRTGHFTALAITVHNFPEGIAVFAATLADPQLGIPIAIAVALHNIPEGISVSVPIYFATGNRRNAFFYSFLSGMAEPLGALCGYVFLLRYLDTAFFGLIFAAVAGIMVYISLDELLPVAREYDQGHTVIFGLIIGMAVMAVSLLLFI